MLSILIGVWTSKQEAAVAAGVCGLSFIVAFTFIFLSVPSLNQWDDTQSYPPGATLPHRLVVKETGEGSINPSAFFDVKAADLGIIFLHNEKLHYVFGDTLGYFVSQRSNTMSHGSDFNASDGLRFDGWIVDSFGRAKELIPSIKESGKEISAIPTAAASVDGTIYIWYMSVREWQWGGNWIANNASVAYSLDDGKTFVKAQNVSWGGSSMFVEFAVVNAGEPVLGGGLVSDYLFLLSTQAGRAGDAYLLRVPRTAILNQLAYEYYNGSVGGSPTSTSDSAEATPIFNGPIGECSVLWDPYLSKWVAVGSSYHFGVNIRTASVLWGPWSSPAVAVPTSEYPSSYGGYSHPSLLGDGGRFMFLMVSLYLHYNVYLFWVDVTSLR